MLVAALAAVAIAGIVAVTTAGGDDDELTAGSQPGQVAQVWPVEVTGGPLPPLGAGADTAIGMPAPGLSGSSFDGSPVAVDGDGPTMLVFLAHWCPHCNREIPVLNAWRDSGTVPAELDVVAVNTAVAPNRDNFPPSQWLPRMDWTWPVIADSATGDAATAYGVSGFPFVVIVGEDGTVVDRWSGELDLAGVQARVAAALA